MESVIGAVLTKLRKIDVDYNTTIPSRQRMRSSKCYQKLHYNLQQHAKTSDDTYMCREVTGAVQSAKPPQNQPPSANTFHASKTTSQNMTSDQ